MKAIRVHFDKLNITDNHIVLWNDKPFTGTGYDLTIEGTLWSEIAYVNGLQEGISRGWSASGILIAGDQWKHGNLHGFAHEWFDDGNLKSKTIYEFGVLVSKKEWDNDGNLIQTFQISETDG